MSELSKKERAFVCAALKATPVKRKDKVNLSRGCVVKIYTVIYGPCGRDRGVTQIHTNSSGTIGFPSPVATVASGFFCTGFVTKFRYAHKGWLPPPNHSQGKTGCRTGSRWRGVAQTILRNVGACDGVFTCRTRCHEIQTTLMPDGFFRHGSGR